jgi:DNA-binding HxlR family transcriptional regulator
VDIRIGRKYDEGSQRPIGVSPDFIYKSKEACARAEGRREVGSSTIDTRIARMVFGKWCVEILAFLSTSGATGFQELKRALGAVSSRILSMKLKDMERVGFVEREVLNTKPLRVRYSLTARGRSAASLGELVSRHLGLLADSQQ